MQNLKKNWLLVWKMTWEICQIFTRAQNWDIDGILLSKLENFNQARKSFKICTLIGSFWSKYKMFELKKYRRVMFEGTEDWCKIWRKTDLCFPNWYGEFSKFSQAQKFRIPKQLDRPNTVLFYVRNKWIAQLTKLFTHVLQNRCSSGIRKCPRKLWK